MEITKRYTIGFVENYIGEDIIVIWYYRQVGDRWKRIYKQNVHKDRREIVLGEVNREADLVPLGRGTEKEKPTWSFL